MRCAIISLGAKASAIASAVLLMVMGGGCAGSNGDGYGRHTPARGGIAPNDGTDMTDLINIEKLDTLPQPVRNDFRRRYPGAGVTSVQQLDAATGALLYEINFLLNGQPEDVIYRPDGTRLTRTSLIDISGGP